MAESSIVDEKTPQDIRQDIQGTRQSLGDKMDQLESNVHDAVQTAKEKLSPSHYIETHPWASFGAAVGIGFLVGQIKFSEKRHSNGDGPSVFASAASGLASSGLMMATSKFFDQEIRDLRNYAISQVLGAAKHLATGVASPELSPGVGRVFDRATRHFTDRPAQNRL